MEDKEILDLFFGRDERAISHTDRKYGESLRLTSRRITGNRQESEECVNDTYFRVWNSVPPDRPFIFIITNMDGVPVFAGTVHDIK